MSRQLHTGQQVRVAFTPHQPDGAVGIVQDVHHMPGFTADRIVVTFAGDPRGYIYTESELQPVRS